MRRLMMLLTVALVMAAMVVLYAGAALAESQLDQQQPNSPLGNYFSVTNSNPAAQTFTAGVSGSLDKVSVHITEVFDCGEGSGDCDPSLFSPGDLIAEIRTVDGSGQPTETVLGSGSVPDNFSPDVNTWADIVLSQPAEVSAGTQYALVLRAPSAGENSYYAWFLDSTDPYAGGYGWHSNPFQGWIGPFEAVDFAFKTYVSPEALLPSTKEQCKNGGWRDFDFPDQGTCVSAVNQQNRR
jgi:hypothetical protein